jgi:DNA recombination protein RmuC
MLDNAFSTKDPRMLPLSLILVALASLAAGYFFGLQKSQSESRALLERAAKAEAEARAAKGNQDALRTEFSELASRLLEEKGAKLREEASSQLGHVLAPLKQNLDDLKSLADRMHKDDATSRASLETTVKALAESHQTFSQQARDLNLTLKGNVKAQGQWGEVMLQRVLDSAGLRQGTEYVLQGKGLELKGPDGEAQKPDAVVFLPEGKHLVIDAKASVDGYLSYANAGDEASRDAAASLQMQALRKQMKDLSEKAYQANEKLSAPEFTLMFVPSEPALGLALQKDPGLFEQAWEKRIIVVGPNTLFGTLKIVAQFWGQERRNKNAEEIARKGGTLYDKFVGFIEDLGLARKAQEEALKQMQQASKKLYEGNGNLVKQAEDLRELGVKNTKRLPEALTERAG